MDTISIDLRKNPDLAGLVADMAPGDPVTLHTTIQHKDGQTVKLTIEDAEEGEAAPPADDTETAAPETDIPAAPTPASPMGAAMGA